MLLSSEFFCVFFFFNNVKKMLCFSRRMQYNAIFIEEAFHKCCFLLLLVCMIWWPIKISYESLSIIDRWMSEWLHHYGAWGLCTRRPVHTNNFIVHDKRADSISCIVNVWWHKLYSVFLVSDCPRSSSFRIPEHFQCHKMTDYTPRDFHV